MDVPTSLRLPSPLRSSGASAAFQPIIEPRLAPVYRLAEGCLYEVGHAHQVARLAARLFDALRKLHGLGPKRRFKLICAALLHDIGYYERARGHHKIALGYILESPLLPWDERRRLIVGSIARYHRRALPCESHEHFALLGRADQRDVCILGGILRLADGLDRTHRSNVRDLLCEADDHRIRIRCRVNRPADIERLAALRKADLLTLALDRRISVECALR